MAGCSPNAKISFSCDRDKKGNYVIKWEVYPKVSGDKINIYMSDNDSIFAEPPTLITDVDDYVAQIYLEDSLQRKFFRLKVDNSFSGIISNRFFKLDNIQNFRDLGGYYTNDNKQLKWAKIYRSGDFSDITNRDYSTLQGLGIKTVIDLREPADYGAYPDLYRGDNMIYLPIASGNRAYIRDKIIDGSFLRGDAIIYTQDMYRTIIEDYADTYAKLFDILCDENNYPVAFHGHLGKDKTGLASYFLLKALGVSSETIEEDYLFSNRCIFEHQVIGEAKYLPEKMQEAATVICKVDISYLDYAEACIISENGSVEAYMEKKLKLTPEKIEKLKKILLYQ